MPRDLPLSNGRLLVTFDREYRIRDIYFPHVGKENHTLGHPFRLGVWVDGQLSWMGREWQPVMRYGDSAMTTEVHARHDALGIELTCHDAVDFYENVLVRRFLVTNLLARPREVRVFFNHHFHIGANEVGDTALFSPETQALIHYKEDVYFLVNCAAHGTVGVQHFACGTSEAGGQEGTWRDAEDGELSQNPIAQGSVDSTLGVTLTLPAKGSGQLDYWMAAGRSFTEVATLNNLVRDKTPKELLRRTRNYWHLWVTKDRRPYADLSPLVIERYKQSLLIIRSQIDAGGAIIAANDTDITAFARDTYSYMWPRDGALVSLALLRAGHSGAPMKFFQFCSEIISPHGYMRHKYNPDGTLASSWHGYVREGQPVLPIQEDETALVIWALHHAFEKYQRIEETAPFYRSLVTVPADFMLRHVDEATGLPLPSHDPWEERWGVHAFTVGAVIAGLRSAASLSESFGEAERATRYAAGAERMLEGLRAVLWSERDGRFARMASPGPSGYTLDMTIDSSLFGLVEFAALAPDDPQALATMRQVEERLWVHTDIGGLARYENDPYQQVERVNTRDVPGNPWFIATLWLARYRLLLARTPDDLARGRELIEWAANRALLSGTMAEQLHPYTGEPLSVSPLTWSHAAYVMAVREYMDRMSKLSACAECGQPVRTGPRLSEQLPTVATP